MPSPSRRIAARRDPRGRRERRRVLRVGGLGAARFRCSTSAAARRAGPRLRGASRPRWTSTGRAIAAIAVVALVGDASLRRPPPARAVRAPRILRDLAIAIGAIAATLAVLSSGHVEVVGIVATSAVLTAVVGWALQDTLANVMGGLALQLDRSVKAGRLGHVRRARRASSARSAGGRRRSRRATGLPRRAERGAS